MRRLHSKHHAAEGRGGTAAAVQVTQFVMREGVIDLGIGHPSISLLPLDLLTEAAAHRLGQGDASPLQYGAAFGNGYFRLALADFLSAGYGSPIAGEELFITSGASQALELVCACFTRPGDTIFVEEPTYFAALEVFRDHDVEIIGIPTDAAGLDVDALEQKLASRRPAILYTIPTFHNPSATTLPAERRARLVELSKAHGFLVVADEVYHLLYFDDPPPPPLAAHIGSGTVLSIGSFSKLLAPGLRLGWIQGAPPLLDRLAGMGLVKSGGGLSPFLSSLVLSALELGLLDEHLIRLRGSYRRRAKALVSALRESLSTQVTCAEPQGGFFVWLSLTGGADADALLAEAVRHGVAFKSGSTFSTSGAQRERLRLSFSFYEREELIEAVARLTQLIRR
jgi:DNA-binding transcriptional MocR family regulator